MAMVMCRNSIADSDSARKGTSGRQAFYVPAQGFDDLMTRLALHCLEGEALQKAKDDLSLKWLLETCSLETTISDR